MREIDFSKSEQYTLSIRLSADGFSFSIHRPQEDAEPFFMTYPVNASYSMTANVKEMLAATEALKHPYKKVNILIDTQRFTPVPFDLFEDEQTEALFHHNFSKGNNEVVLCNILGKSNVALLFGMDKHTHQLLGEHFPNARFFACASPLTEHFTLKSREGNCRKVYAHFRKNVMEIFAFDRNRLLLLNSFGCRHLADKVYYLLYVWQQLGFSQENDQLWLAGTMEEKEELLTELRKFLRQVSVMQSPYNLPFDMQTLMICE